MTASVRAAVMRAPRRLEVAEFPYPELEDGAVLMRVSYSGVCGTDKHTYRGETKQYPGTPHERDIEYPLICGHENVGVVEAVGGRGALDSDGRALRPGDRIVPGANVPCGRCYFCLNKFPYFYCENLEDYGNSLNCTQPPYLFGGWSEYMVLLPGTPIFRVPDALPDHVQAAIDGGARRIDGRAHVLCRSRRRSCRRRGVRRREQHGPGQERPDQGHRSQT